MAENEVYKNTFIELAVGQMFRGINATDGVFSKRSGLQTLCNHFQKSKDFDILAGDYQNIHLPYFNHSIRDYQGNLNCPAGNLFYNNPTVNIEIRNPLNAITYFYGNQTPENPPITTNVTKVNTDSVNGCPSKIEIMDIIAEEELNRALSQYDEWNDEYEYWLAKLLATEVDDEEYEMLLGMVSYYSALKDNHFNSIIVAVMNIWDEESDEDEAESRKQKAAMMRGLEDEMINLRKSVSSACLKTALENISLVPNPTTGELRISPAGGGLRGWNNGELRKLKYLMFTAGSRRQKAESRR